MDLNFMVPKRELTSVLSYLNKPSLDLRTKLKRTEEGHLAYCKLEVTFKFKCGFNVLYCFKGLLEKTSAPEYFLIIRAVNLRLFIAKKTFRRFYIRAAEEMEVCYLTEKSLKS